MTFEAVVCRDNAYTPCGFHCCPYCSMCLLVSIEHVVAIAMFVRASDDATSRASLGFVLGHPQAIHPRIVRHHSYTYRVAASKHSDTFSAQIVCASVAPAVSVMPPLIVGIRNLDKRRRAARPSPFSRHPMTSNMYAILVLRISS